MTEPNITVHNEATLKSIKKLKAASVAVWLVSWAMLWGGFATVTPGESSGLAMTGLAMWMASLIMYIVARTQQWWHHD